MSFFGIGKKKLPLASPVAPAVNPPAQPTAPTQPQAPAPVPNQISKTMGASISVEPKSNKKVKEEKGADKLSAFEQAFLKVKLQDRVLFARHLAVGIKAGMSLQDSLQLIHDQAKSKSFKAILKTLISDTANGMFLSDSLEKFKRVFGELFINLVRVGENSGTLTENLNYLAIEMKKKQQLRSKVRGAMIYPVVIMVATIGIVAVLMIGIFPKILPVFSNLKITLPITTRMLIATSNFLTSYGIWVLLGLILLIAGMSFGSRYEGYKKVWHYLILQLPIVKGISQKVNCAATARILGLLLKSGVRVIEAVNITANALDNRIYQRELRVAAETLRRGEFFSVYLLKKKKLFPLIFTNMIHVGENTGNLTENLEYLSEFYEEEVDEVLKNLSSIVEPFLLLFMGLLVGFIALSVITPVYQISQTLTL